MARFRNASADERWVSYGMPVARLVTPDEVFDVDDAVAESYDQPGIFAPVADVPPPARKTAPPETAPAASKE